MTTFDPTKMTFLIVDDMDNMRRSIRAMLKLIQFGKSYYEAANGLEAWEMISKNKLKVDFIISDWHMPKMNGIALLSKVRGEKSLRDTPFLMITAETNQSIIAEAAEYDVDAYMTKPFVTATLEQKITTLLKNLENPPPFKALLRKARDHREEGDINKAIACAKKAAQLNPQSSRPLRELGILYAHNKDIKTACKLFSRATELNRMDITSYERLGQMYFELGEIDKAIANYSIAVELSPRNAERAFKFADMLVCKKRLQEAEKIFKIVINYNKHDLDLLEQIGEACYCQELFDLATKTYQHIMKSDRDRSHLNKKLGLSLQKAGKNSDAIPIFEKILEEAPEDIEILLALARAYIDMKLPVRADKWVAKVMRLDPANQEAQNLLNRS